MKFPGLKILDRYIVRKFLGTWVFSIAMFIVILVVFDYVEKVDDFITNKAAFGDIVFDYYLNFIPSFINQFSGLLTFIGVIFFTSKLAYNTEIVAMLSSGESFRRLMWPYFVSAAAIFTLALVLNLWVIPPSSAKRLNFESQYVTSSILKSQQFDDDIFRQIEPGTFVYLRNWSGERNEASFFAIEQYENNRLVEVLEAEPILYTEDTDRWTSRRYTVRRFADDGTETFEQKNGLDTLINLNTADLGRVDILIKTLKIGELNRFIRQQKEKGSDMMALFEVERQSRFSYPAAIFILTLIGVSLSSRKVRGGTGLHIGMGITLCFAYILFSRFAEEFAKGGILPAALSVWLPNILFAGIAVWLYIKAPK